MSILVPLDRIDDSPFQVRQSYDPEKVRELAESILRNGLIQTPPARLVCSGGRLYDDIPETSEAFHARYPKRGVRPAIRVQLAVGHCRFRAFQLLSGEGRLPGSYIQPGTPCMPLELRQLTDEQMDMLAWSENHDRGDLNPIEEALAIKARIERRGWTQDEAADQLGLARSTVSNKLRLLRLPDEVLGHIAIGKITERQATALLPAFTLEEEHEKALEIRTGLQNQSYAERRAEIVAEAIEGKSSDDVRRSVQWFLEHLTLVAEKARHVAPVLFVDPEDFESLHRIGRLTMPSEIDVCCELSGGLLGSESRRFLIYGFGYGSGESSASALELLSEETFADREHGPIAQEDDRYGKRHTLAVDGEEPCRAGYRVEIKPADDGEISSVTLLRKPRPTKASNTSERPAPSAPEPEPDDDVAQMTANECVAWLREHGEGADVREGVQWLRRRVRRARKTDAGEPDVTETLVNERTGEPLVDHHQMEPGESYVPAESYSGQADESEPDADDDFDHVDVEAFPVPQHPHPEWRELAKYTKDQLEGVHDKYRHPLHYRHSKDWRKSYLKPEMQEHIRGLLQFHANLQAAHAMTDDQVETFADWLDGLVDEQRLSLNPEGFPWGAWNFAKELQQVENIGTLTGEAWRRYREAHLRHVASFVYHRFLEDVGWESPAATADRIRAEWEKLKDAKREITAAPSVNTSLATLHSRSAELKHLGRRCDELSTEASTAGLDNLAKAIGETRGQISEKHRVYADQITRRQEPEPV